MFYSVLYRMCPFGGSHKLTIINHTIICRLKLNQASMYFGRCAYNCVPEDAEIDFFSAWRHRPIRHTLFANVAASMVVRGCSIFRLFPSGRKPLWIYFESPAIYAFAKFILSVSYCMIYNYYFSVFLRVARPI